MKVLSVFGTRPEMIKMWGTLKKLDELNFDHKMIHTGQNFTPELKEFFFDDLQLREPDYQLKIDTTSYGREVADVISKTDEIMGKEKPDCLLILGDTYSGLSIMPAILNFPSSSIISIQERQCPPPPISKISFSII